MRRARDLVFCVGAFAALVLALVLAHTERLAPREAALTESSEEALAPSPLIDDASATDDSTSTGVARDMSRFDAAAEPTNARESVDTRGDVETAADDVHAVTGGLEGTADHVPVRFVDESPVELRLDGIDEQVAFTEDPAKIVSSDVELARGSGGEVWLQRSQLEALLESAKGVRPVYFACVEQHRSRMRLGYVSGPLDAAMPELVLTEVPAARVTVCAKSNGTGAFGLSVDAQLLEAAGDDVRRMRVAAGRGLEVERCHLQFGADVRRAPLPVCLLPGRWQISFSVPSAPLLEIAPIEVEIARGQQEVTVVVPDLYSVTVHAPSLGAGTRIRLRPEDAPSIAAPARASRDNVELDAHHRSTFNGLPAGHYVLTHGASHAPQTIVVPCGEVLYEPRRSDAYEVRLAPLDGGGQGALARAGFQTGDVLLEFNGRGLREHDDLDALLEVIAESAASVRVRRGAQTLDLRLGPMPDAGDPWATFDADFVPAWR